MRHTVWKQSDGFLFLVFYRDVCQQGSVLADGVTEDTGLVKAGSPYNLSP